MTERKPLIRVAAGDIPAMLRQLREAVLFDDAALAVLTIAGEPSSDDLIAALVPSDIALVVETSGSTDAPKRVMLSAGALRASAGTTEQWFGGQHGQWLLALPATYIAGVQVLVRSILAGTEPVVMPQGHFDPLAFAAASARLDAAGARFTSLVPVQLARLVEAAADDAAVAGALRSFDRILLGGQAAPAGLVERAAGLGAREDRPHEHLRAGDVGRGQREQPLAVSPAEPLLGRPRARPECGRREHHALRGIRRPARLDDDGDVARHVRGDEVVTGRLDVAGDRQHRECRLVDEHGLPKLREQRRGVTGCNSDERFHGRHPHRLDR